MAQNKNIIGPPIRRLRCQRELTQRALAVKLQLAGWWIDRAGVSKIEGGRVRVHDYRQLYLASVLRVSVEDLFPAIAPTEQIDGAVNDLMKKRR